MTASIPGQAQATVDAPRGDTRPEGEIDRWLDQLTSGIERLLEQSDAVVAGRNDAQTQPPEGLGELGALLERILHTATDQNLAAFESVVDASLELRSADPRGPLDEVRNLSDTINDRADSINERIAVAVNQLRCLAG